MGEGDFVLIPKGSEYAHVLINESDEDLVYLCMSTMVMPDVVHYPDSDKLGVLENMVWAKGVQAGAVDGFYARRSVDYWEGEE